MINSNFDIDLFFHNNVLSKHQREEVNHLTFQFISQIAIFYSDYTKISYENSFRLIRQNTYYTISMFLDSSYRLDSNFNLFKSSHTNNSQPILNLSNNTLNLSITNSKLFRCIIFNKLLSSLNFECFFDEHFEDIKPLVKKDALPRESFIFFLLHKISLIPKLFSTFTSLLKYYFNLFFSSLFAQNLVRVGFINIQKRYFYLLKNIEWVELQKNVIQNTPFEFTEDSNFFYNKYLKKFLKTIPCLELSNQFTNIVPNDSFRSLLFYLIIAKLPPSFFDNRLLSALDFYQNYLSSLHIKFLFSQGGLQSVSFSNDLICVAASNLHIPIVDFEHGQGNYFYKIGDGWDLNDNFPFGSNLYLNWGGLSKEFSSFKILSVSNPEYSNFKSSQLFNLFAKKNRILYSPITLSNLFAVENWLTISSYDMNDHRLWESNIFTATFVDPSFTKSNLKFFIKIKGFGLSVFEKYEHFAFPQFSDFPLPISFITSGNSKDFFPYFSLHITASCSTTFANSMAFNIPTICLWDLKVFEVSEEYEYIYQILCDVGIIVHNSSDLRSSIIKFSDLDFWFSPSIQSIRRLFCDLLARNDSNWAVHLNNIFLTYND